MGVVSLTGIEFSRFARSTFTIAAVAVVTLLPTIYASLYLTANWDTTGNIDSLTAAVVNKDAGAVLTDLDGDQESIDLGARLVDTLTTTEDAGFSWVSVPDEGAALADLGTGTYSAVIVIPATFSDDVASSTSPAPTQAVLEIYTDDASNYLLGQITNSIATSIRSQLGTTITTEYLDTVLLGFTDLHDGMTAASDGATQLAEATVQAKDGASALANGLADLDDGTDVLATGLETLSAANRSLLEGLANLETAATDLPASATALADGAENAHAGAQMLGSGLSAIDDGAGALADTTGQLAEGLDGLSQLAAAHPDWTISELQAVLAGQGTSLNAIAATGHALADGAGELSTATSQAAAGAVELTSGLGSLSSGLDALAEKAPALTHGIAALRDGATHLADGADSAASGASRLADGTQQLVDGSATLTDGLAAVADGSTTLAEELRAGTDSIPSYTDSEREHLAAAVADPVDAEHTTLNAVETFGRGIAPFFISLTLWIGGIALYFVFRPISPRALASTAHTSRIALSGLLTGLVVSLFQAGLIAVLLQILGISGPSMAATAGFVALTAVVFTAIHHLLTASLGGPGRFLALLLLILQLTSAGGTYPVQVAPAFFQAIAPFLPMTYTVDALRRLIAEGWTTAVTTDAIVLGAFGILAVLLAFPATKALRTWNTSRLHPALQI